MMKKLLLTMIVTMLTFVGAWAQIGTYGTDPNTATISASGSTLTITGKGDITNINGTVDVYTTTFTESAIGNVFTSNTGAAVTTSTLYNVGTPYFTANRTWNKLFDGSTPTLDGNYMSNVTTGSYWDASKLSGDNAYMYAIYQDGSTQTWKTGSNKLYKIESITDDGVKISDEIIDGTDASAFNIYDFANYSGTNYLKYVATTNTYASGDIAPLSAVTLVTSSDHSNYLSNTPKIRIDYNARKTNQQYTPSAETFNYNGTDYAKYVLSSTELADESLVDFNSVTLFTKSELEEGYIVEETRYTINQYSPFDIYVSSDEGENKTLLTKGQTYTYKSGDWFFTPNSTTYEQIANNEQFFEEHDSYIHTDHSTENVAFVTGLKNAILGGSYTDVVFANEGAGALTINPAIVQAILFPNNAQNGKIKNLDLGAATITTFERAFEQATGVYTYNLSLKELTLPLNDSKIVPANVIPDAYKDAHGSLRTVRVPADYTKIGDRAFTGQSLITSVYLPEGITEIGEEAFYLCSNMTKVSTNDTKNIHFPEALTTIGESAFKSCGSLNATPEDPLEFYGNGNGGNITTIKKSAFSDCGNIKYIIFREGVKFIGNSAFALSGNVDHSQPTITFPNTVKYIGPGAFNFRYYNDIFFKSERAPLCPMGYMDNAPDAGVVNAFYEEIHMGNNGFTLKSATGNADDISKGYANRENYVASSGLYFTVIHYPNNLSAENAATYQDITRRYITSGKQLETPNTFSSADVVEIGEEDVVMSAFGVSTPLNHQYFVSYYDTYAGAQKVWPSQGQWMRSYIVNANGYNWNGVTKYRPVLTGDDYKLMIDDGLEVSYTDGNKYVITNEILSNAPTYTSDEAIAYNAKLPGAVKENDVKETYTEEEAITKNATLGDAVAVGDTSAPFTKEQADAFNAQLPGAVKDGDLKTPAVEAEFYTWEQWHEANPYDLKTQESFESDLANAIAHPEWNNAWITRVPASPAVYYNAETAAEHNMTLEGHVDVGGTITYTAETAAIYNASLPDAIHEGDTKSTYTADEAIEKNATLEGAVSAGSPKDIKDFLSMIAFQGTRRFVLGDGDTQSTPEYPLDIKGAKWWTICVPFNMTKEMVDETFGEGTHVCLFSQVDRDAKSAQKKITLYFQHDVYVHKTERDNDEWNFSTSNTAPADDDIVIWAHEAYMIRPTKDEADPTKYAVKKYRPLAGNPRPTIVTASDKTKYRFVGNLEKNIPVEDSEGKVIYETKKIPQYSYMYAKKKTDANYKFWFNASTTISWAPNKCVVQATALDGGLTDNNNFFGTNNAKQNSVFGDYFFMEEDAEATGLENVTIVAGEGKDAEVVYNLNGQVINKSNMRGGIYIKNGKKFIVR